MNLYELNKQLVVQLPPMENQEVEKKKQLIADFKKEQSNVFYMLLSNEINYFTLFKLIPYGNEASFEDEVIACLRDNGAIQSIELVEDGSAIEIWVKKYFSDDSIVFYLFPYDKGVIVCQ